MGGKRKPAQRSKGNTRPSSSGRCAEKLAKSGASVTGFIGFESLHGDASFVPAIQGSDEVDATVDGDFRLVMRKMTKRDVTTKIKAIQEFTALCKERNPEIIKGTLPFWPRLFNKLSMDHDRRVREAVFKAQEQLVLKTRKNLAPYLRSIMGNWLLAQCDPYGPTATAAAQAFDAAFPPTKQTEAITFCKQEILSLIEDNLFQQTAQTLSDPQITPQEEMEGKYHRIIMSSLLGLKLFLTRVAKCEHEELQPFYEKILSEKKFWKYGRSEIPMIRSAWFQLVSTLCQVLPAAVCAHASSVCPVVLGSLDEVDPAISPVVWEAAMFVLVTVDDCWNHVNARKAVLPKLWAILQDGGRGNACAIFPNLLPFLSKVPTEVVGEGMHFYNEFFAKLRNGLSLKKVETSSTEYNAVVTAFMECLKYTLIQHADKPTSKQAENLLVDQLFPVLQASLTEANSLLPSTRLYPLLSDLIRYWHRSSNDAASGQTFKNLTDMFWKELGRLGRLILVDEKDDPRLQVRINSLIELFLCLQDSTRTPRRKSFEGKVRFEESDLSESNLEGSKIDSQTKLVDAVSLSSSVVSSLENSEDSIKDFKDTVDELEVDDFVSDDKNPLHAHVRKLSHLALHETGASNSIEHLNFAGYLVVTFPSEQLFSSLLDSANEPTEKTQLSSGDICRAFFNQIVCHLLLLGKNIDSSKKADWALGVVNLSTAAYDCATDDVRLEIMSALCKTCDPYILERLIEMFTWKRARDKVFVTWLKSAELGQALVSLAQRLCSVSLEVSEASKSSETEVIWHLLSFSLCTDGNLEPLVSSSYLSQILEAFHQALPKPGTVISDSSQNLKTVVKFVCDLAARLFTNVRGCWQIPAAENLLLTLFLITCQPSTFLPEKLLKKVEEAWQKGMTSLVEMKGGYMNSGGFFQLAALSIQQYVTNEVSSLEGLNHILKTTMVLIRHLHSCLPLTSEPWTLVDNGTVLCFLDALLPSAELRIRLRNQLGNQWLLKVIVEGELTIPELAECKTLPWKQSESIQHVFASAFISQLLWQICEESKEMIAEEKDEGGEQASVVHSVSLLATSTQFEDLLYSYLFCKMVADYRGDVDSIDNKVAKELKGLLRLLDTTLPKLALTMDEETKLKLTQQLLAVSRSQGRLWSLCLLEFINLIGGPAPAADSSSEGTDIGILHTDQVLLQLRVMSSVASIQRPSTAALSVIDVEETDISKLVHVIGLSAKEMSQQCCPAEDTKDTALAVMDFMVKCRESKNDWYLFACDVSQAEWQVVAFNIEVQKLLLAVVGKYGEHLSSHHWDFILCGLCSWIQSCVESQTNLTKQISVLAFAKYSSSLVHCVANVIQAARSSRSLAHHSLLTEWDEFFSDGIFSVLFPLVVKVAEEKAHSATSYLENSLLISLARALEQIPTEHIINSGLLPNPLANKSEINSFIPAGMQAVLNQLCPLLTASVRPIQLCAFRILTKVFPLLGEYEEGERPADEEESSRPLPYDLRTVITEATAVVNSLFSEMMFGDVFSVQFSPDSYSYTLGYLLSWSLVMELFSAASSELRSQYASYLQSSGLMHDMLANVFHLIPENAGLPKDYLPSTEACSKTSVHRTLFSEKPEFDLAVCNCTIELQHQACQVYFQAVKKLPALVRQWWNNQDKKSSAVVDRITSKFVSPLLCMLELQSVQHSDKKFENMTVKARPSAREVVATYTIDEVSMELIIKLASNHPLGPIGVECGKRVGVGNNQWRNWMLQLNTFLTYQNGSILDGLTLWKRNVDKKFEGIEECYICFYVLHGSNCQLPRVSCRTCKKKFHSACLYKWFSTSVQSTCPLCRNLF